VGEPDGVGDLDHDALVQRELVALVQRVAVLPVHVAQKVVRLVVDHDAVVEGVEAEVAVLPPLLLPPHVVREETSELGDRRRVLRGGGGGLQRSRHRVRVWFCTSCRCGQTCSAGLSSRMLATLVVACWA